MAAFGTEGSKEEAFTILFLGMWIGPLIITVNVNLLGADWYFFSHIVELCKPFV